MAVYEGHNIIHDGLIFCLDAGNVLSYPGSGSVWYDLVANYSGTIYNATYSNSKFNFTGNAIVDFGTVINGTYSDFSWFAWCKPSSYGACRAVCQWTTTGDDAPYIQANGYWSMYPSGLANNPIPSGTTWSYIGFTLTSGNAGKYYKNEILDGTFTGNNDQHIFNYMHVSGINTGDGENFRGDISNVKIYNRILSATEILQNYNVMKGRFN